MSGEDSSHPHTSCFKSPLVLKEMVFVVFMSWTLKDDEDLSSNLLLLHVRTWVGAWPR